MTASLTIQGRPLTPADLQSLHQWVGANPPVEPVAIVAGVGGSLGLAQRLRAGQLKDMAVRTLLVKLEQRGLIQLPVRRRVSTNRMRCGVQPASGQYETVESIDFGLAELEPLSLAEVSGQRPQRVWVKATLARVHYLGFGGPVGENLQYVRRDGQSRPLACLGFGAAAWKCQDRDRYIGWSVPQRQQHLGWVANNVRFVIFPWARVPGLGSWILGRIASQIGQDWEAKYGHPVVLLETFVERERFRGTVYRAANWQRVGVTAGRTRQGRHTCLRVPIKDIYLYPLRREFRPALCEGRVAQSYCGKRRIIRRGWWPISRRSRNN